ncbi:MAG: UDP-N-acetylmuramoyl-L-alanyl-D-glutamate--2,6-diaminopimelate ligase [Candidatus Dojkabacteria bacterium]|nr:MAG: UDP-N-acetylmuramoyl-L-alanyl-D-glutamate--2,6-diaminopimelate ligase [Candidatus Dojkabacteria bacterium]
MSKLLPQNLKNKKHLLTSKFYHNFYGKPSKQLKIIGVTGTDGKTTTSTILYEMLKLAGYKVGLISTISAKIGSKEYSTGFHVTSPSPKDLQKFLKEMVKEGLEYVVLETTSHGLDQYRVGGVQYCAAVFTNVSHEHLDYHKTYDNYLQTKARLMELLDKDGFAVINKDDQSYEKFVSKAKALGIDMIDYGFSDGSDMKGDNLQQNGRMSFRATLHSTDQNIELNFDTNLQGKYNAQNIMAAAVAAYELGAEVEAIEKAVHNVKSLKGRWEVLQEHPFKAVVDFAHTPNALENVLSFARADNREGKLIVVFGSAGLRDVTKRPLMGEAAGKHADYTILTAEDPRGESVTSISNMIAEGIKKHSGKYEIIEDRKEAIAAAIKMAKKGDTVVVTGKGHEESLNLDGKSEIPWSDQKVMGELLNSKK